MKEEEKLYQLRQLLRGLDKCIVTFSGGVDSSFLLKIACEELRKNVIAVIVESVTMFSNELKFAENFAASLGAKTIIKKINLLDAPEIKTNQKLRCYNCKFEIFKLARQTADEHNIKYVLDGTNYDDLLEFRPGLKAAREYNIKSPLKELKFTKIEIRNLLKKMNVNIWDKESNTCLLTRFPEGYEVTLKELKIIEELENFIRGLYKFKKLRLRVNKKNIRIDVDNEDKYIFYNKQLKNIIYKKIINAGYNMEKV